MILYSESQLKLFKNGSKIKFNLIDGDINEILDGTVTYNNYQKQEIFVNCKYGEYQYDYKELKEVVR